MSNSMDPDAARARLFNHQTEAHPFCFVCSGSNPMGLTLRSQPQADGSIQATFLGHSALEGYSGLLHGGVIASLLDGVMTSCLFARGVHGFTAELNVRYHQPVAAAEEVCLHAWLDDDAHGLFQLRAELVQGNVTKASAAGKFLRQHE